MRGILWLFGDWYGYVTIATYETNSPGLREWDQSLGVRGRSQSIFLIYIFEFHNTFYHCVVQIPRRVDPPQNCENIFIDYFDVSGNCKHISFFLGK